MRAKEWGLELEYVRMDSWYARLENWKLIASLGWRFLTRLKSNRPVNPGGRGNGLLSKVEIHPEGRVVHLRDFGFVKVFRAVSRDGDVEYWATNDLGMPAERRTQLEKWGWGIEIYHLALQPFNCITPK